MDYQLSVDLEAAFHKHGKRVVARDYRIVPGSRFRGKKTRTRIVFELEDA